jgi:hypothetical protein
MVTSGYILISWGQTTSHFNFPYWILYNTWPHIQLIRYGGETSKRTWKLKNILHCITNMQASYILITKHKTLLTFICILLVSPPFRYRIRTVTSHTYNHNYITPHHNFGGRNSSVGIATRYGLDGPGIESRWGGGDFQHPASYTKGTGSFPGVKRTRCGAYHPPPSSAEV